ncbi:hypothetical protein Tdes44962_MAKER00439 [Teratosphaeria destructans]|uniref:Uncharacterized protein n=1 Tax=Teratosphaeria destructans TaxID=418781 RepID=A0A9W7SSU9_9PEZI|nr:hypothetical protein Tdes44962_MAKER00439 [Teratosphaeria destructans]
MCKSLAIHHTCTHTIPFRLSTCRGTYAHPTLKPHPHPHPPPSKPGCTSLPTLTLLSTTPCGTCLATSLHTRLEQDLAATKELHSSHGETNGQCPPPLPPAPAIREAEAQFDRESWALQRRFPTGRFKVFRRPERGLRVRRGSLLRCEVRAEDVVVRACGTLEQELAAAEGEEPGEVRECGEGVGRAGEAVVEEEEEDGVLGGGGSDWRAPASVAGAHVASAGAVRKVEDLPPCPRRRAPDPPTRAAPQQPCDSFVQTAGLRRKAKVASMRRKAKGQGDDFGEDWFKCVRASLAVV